jgi:glycosyltransferase involved in cell wall biosynthesis
MRIATLPAITYFHENQWTYPESPRARHDMHYGYTNLLTALSSDEVWFNSEFHQREFLRASRDFVARMPDETKAHNLDGLTARCVVVPPGFEPVATRDDLVGQNVEGRERPIVIGWSSRWEHDKRPDRFEQLLAQLADRGLEFELLLLGPRPVKPPASLRSIEHRYASSIRFSGFVADRAAYEARLREMDIVVSTADHEFFGIAVCEAISAGAIPLLPNGLSYPELVDAEFLYRSLPEAVDKIVAWSRRDDRGGLSSACRRRIAPLMIDEVIAQIDRGIERVAAARG